MERQGKTDPQYHGMSRVTTVGPRIIVLGRNDPGGSSVRSAIVIQAAIRGWIARCTFRQTRAAAEWVWRAEKFALESAAHREQSVLAELLQPTLLEHLPPTGGVVPILIDLSAAGPSSIAYRGLGWSAALASLARKSCGKAADVGLSFIAFGDTFTIALTSKGELWSVGAGSGRGELGRGGGGYCGRRRHREGGEATKECWPPGRVRDYVQRSQRGGLTKFGLGSVSGIPDLRVEVHKLCTGREHTAALTRDGKVFTFGDNSVGQLGYLVNNSSIHTTSGIGHRSNSEGTSTRGTGTQPWVRKGAELYGRQCHTGTFCHLSRGSGGTKVGLDGWRRIDQVSQKSECASLEFCGTPREVLLPARATDLACGGMHTLVIVAGNPYSWGGGDVYNHLPRVAGVTVDTGVREGEEDWAGLGSRGEDWVGMWQPRRVKLPGVPFGTVRQVHAGDRFSLAVDEAGKMYSWGANGRGQTGLGTIAGTVRWPEMVVTPPDLRPLLVQQVSCGAKHSVAIEAATGTVVTWGCGEHGQLGVGEGCGGNRAPRNYCDVVGGNGRGYGGQGLGNARTSFSPTAADTTAEVCGRFSVSEDRRWPVEINTLRGVKVIQVAAGARHTVALSSSGTLWLWGTGGISHREDQDPNRVGDAGNAWIPACYPQPQELPLLMEHVGRSVVGNGKVAVTGVSVAWCSHTSVTWLTVEDHTEQSPAQQGRKEAVATKARIPGRGRSTQWGDPDLHSQLRSSVCIGYGVRGGRVQAWGGSTITSVISSKKVPIPCISSVGVRRTTGSTSDEAAGLQQSSFRRRHTVIRDARNDENGAYTAVTTKAYRSHYPGIGGARGASGRRVVHGPILHSTTTSMSRLTRKVQSVSPNCHGSPKSVSMSIPRPCSRETTGNRVPLQQHSTLPWSGENIIRDAEGKESCLDTLLIASSLDLDGKVPPVQGSSTTMQTEVLWSKQHPHQDFEDSEEGEEEDTESFGCSPDPASLLGGNLSCVKSTCGGRSSKIVCGEMRLDGVVCGNKTGCRKETAKANNQQVVPNNLQGDVSSRNEGKNSKLTNGEGWAKVCSLDEGMEKRWDGNQVQDGDVQIQKAGGHQRNNNMSEIGSLIHCLDCNQSCKERGYKFPRGEGESYEGDVKDKCHRRNIGREQPTSALMYWTDIGPSSVTHSPMKSLLGDVGSTESESAYPHPPTPHQISPSTAAAAAAAAAAVPAVVLTTSSIEMSSPVVEIEDAMMGTTGLTDSPLYHTYYPDGTPCSPRKHWAKQEKGSYYVERKPGPWKDPTSPPCWGQATTCNIRGEPPACGSSEHCSVSTKKNNSNGKETESLLQQVNVTLKCDFLHGPDEHSAGKSMGREEGRSFIEHTRKGAWVQGLSSASIGDLKKGQQPLMLGIVSGVVRTLKLADA